MKISDIKAKFPALFFLGPGVLFGSLLFAQPEKPILSMRVEPERFSPNGDGHLDQVFIYPVLQSAAPATRWRLEVFSSNRKRVGRLNGAGLPALIKWDGFDRKGLPVKDGTYTAQLRVWGPGFKLLTRYQFFADLAPPEVRVDHSTPVVDNSFLEKGVVTFQTFAADESPLEKWQLQIIDTTGRTVHVYWSTGPLTEVKWNAVDRDTGVMVPPGNYQVAFQAWDAAGNESAPFFTDLAVQVTVREMLQNTLQLIQVIESPIGLIVRLPVEDLFGRKSVKPSINLKGKALLREVAILINAYPGAPVLLDGYARSKKSSGADKDLSSYYAWNVYSYLVKTGNVKASRLTVKGRGRSALFSRREVNVPFIRNGVEVILEGNREW